MQSNIPTLGLYAKCILTVIALLLAVLLVRPLTHPEVASAQSAYSSGFYIEPGTTMLRKPDGSEQVQGKVVIDLRNGSIWGFPTLSKAPYPVDTLHSEPPVSHPMYLGRYDFSQMTNK